MRIKEIDSILLDKEVRRILDLIYHCPKNIDETTIVLKSYNNRVNSFDSPTSPIDNDEFLIRVLQDDKIIEIVGSGVRIPNYSNIDDFDWQLEHQLKEKPKSYVYMQLKILDMLKIEEIVCKIIDKFIDSKVNFEDQIELVKSNLQYLSNLDNTKILNIKNTDEHFNKINAPKILEELNQKKVVKIIKKTISVFGKNTPKWDIELEYLPNNKLGNSPLIYKTLVLYKDTGILVYPKLNNKNGYKKLRKNNDTFRLLTYLLSKANKEELKDIEILNIVKKTNMQKVKPGLVYIPTQKIHDLKTALNNRDAFERNSNSDGYIVKF